MYSIEYTTTGGSSWISYPGQNLEGVTIVKAKEDDRIFARVSVDGVLNFYGSYCSALFSLLSTDIKVQAQIKRDGTTVVNGYLNLLGTWDIDNNTCELSFDVVDQYTPVFKLWDEDVSLTTLTSTISYSFDSSQITEELPKASYPNYSDLPPPENNYTYLGEDATNWIFAKQLIPFPADGWDYDQGLPGDGYPFWTKYPGFWSKQELNTQTVTDEFSGFFELVNVLYKLCTNSGCDFDETDFSTYLEDDSELNNIFIGYKKRVINPGVYIKEKQISLSDILKIMKAIFNLDWYLDAGDLKFKHPSELNFDLPDLTRYPAHDLTTFEGINWVAQKKVFNYSVDIPFKEIWNVESSNQVDFNGLPIRYEIESDQMVEFDLSNFQANFTELMNAQSENYTGDVSDDGFCIVACDASRVIVNRTGILSGDTLINGKLALSQLHYDHFKTGGRYFTSGEMNGSNATFTNVKRTREIIEISAPATVDDFIFSNLVKLSIGYCELISVTEYLNGDYAKIKLMY